MEKNEFNICCLCQKMDVSKMYFLPCLHVFCNKCLAAQIQQHISVESRQPHTCVENENREFLSTSDDGIYFKVQTRQRFRDASLASSMMEAHKNADKKYSSDGGGYEIPKGPILYQNAGCPGDIETLIKDGGEYEEVKKLQLVAHLEKQIVDTDDETFEEVDVNKFNEKHTSNIPPRPSFKTKQRNLKLKTAAGDCSEMVHSTHFPFSPDHELPKNKPAQIVTIEDITKLTPVVKGSECPLCRCAFWISGAELINSIHQFYPLRSNINDELSRAEIEKFVISLNDIPSVCESNFCSNSNKNMFCATCGKAICDICSSQLHTNHYVIQMELLISRHKALVESYVDINKDRRCYFLDMVNKFNSNIAHLSEAKAKTVEMLREQKTSLLLELEKIFKDRLNAFEKNICFEIAQLETSVSLLNEQLAKIDHFVHFSKTFLSQDECGHNELEIMSGITNSHWALEQFKVPELKVGKIHLKPGDVGTELLSSMLGDAYLKRKSLFHESVEKCSPQVLKHEASLIDEVSAQLDLAEKVPKQTSESDNAKSLKWRRHSRRLSKIFKRSSHTSKHNCSKVSSDKENAERQDNIAPNISLNMQLISDEEECRVVDFATSSGCHIVALDSANHRLKILNLINDTFEVVTLGQIHKPQNVAVIEEDGQFRFVISQNGSNCVKLYNNESQEIGDFGSGYLLDITSIATNSLKQIFVADIMHRKVFVHDESGKLLYSFPRGVKHGKNRCLNDLQPKEIKISPINDDIFLYDGAKRSYFVFDKVGIYLFQILTYACQLNKAQPLPVTTNFTRKDGLCSEAEDFFSDSKSHGSECCPKIENYSNIVFDGDGYIYQRSFLGDRLFTFDSNGKCLNQVEYHAQHLKSCMLITILDCPIKFELNGLQDEDLSLEKCIVTSADRVNINIYKLGQVCPAKESTLSPKLSVDYSDLRENEGSAQKNIDNEKLNLESCESNYIVMASKNEADKAIYVTHDVGPRHGTEHLYSMIGENDNKDDAETTITKKSRQRFSDRFKNKFFKNNDLGNRAEKKVAGKLDINQIK